MSIEAWELVVEGLHRPEAPCPDGNGNLWFSDIAGEGAIYRLDAAGHLHKLHSGRAHVGGIVPHAGGGLVVSGHTVSVLDEEGGERVLLDADGGWGFNDITTDAAGNVFAGKHTERPQLSPPTIDASLWRIATDGTVAHCYDGITMTNGLRCSPDATRLYHADTLRKLVWVSDVDADGMPRNRRVHHELSDGMPDGMAIDETGCLWIAAIGAGKIVRVTPDGSEDTVLLVPRAYVSAVCFGGSDGRDLVATAFGGEPYDREHTGCVLATRVDVAGLPITPARV